MSYGFLPPKFQYYLPQWKEFSVISFAAGVGKGGGKGKRLSRADFSFLSFLSNYHIDEGKCTKRRTFTHLPPPKLSCNLRHETPFLKHYRGGSVHRGDKSWAMKRARPSKKVWCSGLGSNYGLPKKRQTTASLEYQENELWVFRLFNNHRKLGRTKNVIAFLELSFWLLKLTAKAVKIGLNFKNCGRRRHWTGNS